MCLEGIHAHPVAHVKQRDAVLTTQVVQDLDGAVAIARIADRACSCLCMYACMHSNIEFPIAVIASPCVPSLLARI